MKVNDEITTGEAARILGVSVRRVGRLIEEKRIPIARRIHARLFLVRRSDVLKVTRRAYTKQANS
jgi:excisionase family DNA binding protein